MDGKFRGLATDFNRWRGISVRWRDLGQVYVGVNFSSVRSICLVWACVYALGCSSGSVAGEFPSRPRCISGGVGGALQPQRVNSHQDPCVSGRAGASESRTGRPTGILRRFALRSGGNSRQGCAGSTARALRGRSVWPAVCHSCPSRSRGNLLLEKWAGGGDDDGGPSLASARASRRPFHPRDALQRGSSFRSFN